MGDWERAKVGLHTIKTDMFCLAVCLTAEYYMNLPGCEQNPEVHTPRLVSRKPPKVLWK